MSLLSQVQNLYDLYFASKYFIHGTQRPDVVEGYFVKTPEGQNQSLLYNSMLSHGFAKTKRQIIFPGQTAGLIRTINPPIGEMDEIHVRFYDDGVIASELEPGRSIFKPHFRGERQDGSNYLERIIDTELRDISEDKKQEIKQQIGSREFEATRSNMLTDKDLITWVMDPFVRLGFMANVVNIAYANTQGYSLLGYSSFALALALIPVKVHYLNVKFSFNLRYDHNKKLILNQLNQSNLVDD